MGAAAKNTARGKNFVADVSNTTAASALPTSHGATKHATEVASKVTLGPDILQQILAKYTAAPAAQMSDTP